MMCTPETSPPQRSLPRRQPSPGPHRVVPVFLDARLMFLDGQSRPPLRHRGATHGAYNAAATENLARGAQVPPIRLYARSEVREDIMRMLEVNVRHPRDFEGDLAAQIGSVHLGERRMQELALGVRRGHYRRLG